MNEINAFIENSIFVITLFNLLKFKTLQHILFHKNNFQKVVKSSRICSFHHVDLLGDHPEPQLVEILQDPQQIDVLAITGLELD